MSFVTYSQLGKMGRLGNQLMELSSTIGIAVKNGLFYAFPDWEYQRYFTNPLPNNKSYIEIYKKPYKNIPEKAFTYEDILLNDEYNYDVLGYRQSPRYWTPHATEIIKKYLEFDKNVLDKVNKKWYNVLFLNTCAVHFRLTDYTKFGDYHTNLHLTHYYKDAVGLIESQNYKNEPVKYIVFSDDVAWCEKNALDLLGNNLYSNNVLFSKDFNEVEDLVFMGLCKNFIIANSTYSWMAAYLSKNESKIVISPGTFYNWFGKLSPHSTVDLIPNGWCKL